MSQESSEIRSYSDGYWEKFYSPEEPNYKIKGKYLFFSMDRRVLIKIAKREISKGPFHRAKTQMSGLNDAVPGTGKDYVLCLYYKDDSKKYELADKYQEKDGVRYRYWKSDAATRRGEYSEEFLKGMPPGVKDGFTGDDSDEKSA